MGLGRGGGGGGGGGAGWRASSGEEGWGDGGLEINNREKFQRLRNCGRTENLRRLEPA